MTVRYSDFEDLIHRMAASASPAACRFFALDTLSRLDSCAREAISEEFTEGEKALLDEVLGGLEQKPAEILKQKFQNLDDSLHRDAIRAIEFDPKITDLLCAIDNWLAYRSTSDPEHIAHIAINMVNAIDYDIVGTVGGYSIENVLAAPEMLAEHERQWRLLAGSPMPRTTKS